MPSQAQDHFSTFSAAVFSAIALLVVLAASPLAAQNSVPATAREPAKMPQFAAKLAPLAHPVSQRKVAPPHLLSRKSAPPGDNVIYDNGPINGNTDAWAINFGFVVADSFPVTSGQVTVTGLSFGAWLFAGDVVQTVDVSITSEPFGGTTFFSGTVSFTESGCVGNGFGFNVCAVSGSFDGPVLNDGTYWVNLQNAVDPNGDPVYWDENAGPSMAVENSVGSIPSESFALVGDGGNGCPPGPRRIATSKAVTIPPSPTQSYRVIYNFTGGGDGGAPSSSLVIDPAGNLYGTASDGGPSGDGTVFKLVPGVSGWRFSRLYSFTGANGHEPNSTLVRSPDGRFYGTTYDGGLSNGVLFGLSPAGHILPSVFSNWMETSLYSFTGGSDGGRPRGNLVLDSSGNFYGSAEYGGANQNGTLYEFSNGGIQVLHAFPAFPSDGSYPAGVISGSDGLYGITSAGGANGGGTLYTTAGGYQVLHSFTGSAQEGSPTSLATDQAGNLYGTSSYSYVQCWDLHRTEFFGTSVFQLSPPDWNPLILENNDFLNFSPVSYSISTDAQGSIYGANSSTEEGDGNIFKLTCCWNYTDLHDFSGGPGDGAYPQASPVVDAQGNIYGTTQSGGLYGHGVVWEISP